MRPVINTLCLFFIFNFSCGFLLAQPVPIENTMRITINLSDKISSRFEKYLVYAYNQLGYKVAFEKILSARAREMVDAGQIDAMMIAEKEISQVYTNILRVPVLLARGRLMLYCNKQVSCLTSSLNNEKNIIGVVSGNSISANYMRQKRASTYGVKSHTQLGLMLEKERLKYVLIIKEDQIGNIGNLDENLYKQIEVTRSEGYHFIHKKHQHLLPDLTLALKSAIEKYGPLVEIEEVAHN